MNHEKLLATGEKSDLNTPEKEVRQNLINFKNEVFFNHVTLFNDDVIL